MKSILAALLLVSFASSSVLADSPEAILKDYRGQAARSLERLNQSLEKAATPLITKLVKDGDTDGAERLGKQVKAKIADEPVPAPQASAVLLFSQYDEARATQLAVIRKPSIARIESLLKTADGSKFEVVTELGKVRAEIETGVAAKGISKSFLTQNDIPTKWGYFLSNDYSKRYGTLNLHEDGTVSIDAANPSTGTWTTKGDPTVLMIDLKSAETAPEKTKMLIKGREATLKRVSGMRYLKAD